LIWRFVDLTVAAVVFAAIVPLHAINLAVTTADIDRALVIARGRDAERARFHAPYIVTLKDPTVQSIEIITEFRRIVLLAEDHILKGDRGFAYSTRIAQAGAATWKNRVSVVARLRFHPMNTYVDIPKIEISLDGPNADRAFIGLLKEPLFALGGGPGEPVPILGAVAEGVFEAGLIGQTQRTATVKLDGKTLITRLLDFSSIE
jgi:hypothetical protein